MRAKQIYSFNIKKTSFLSKNGSLPIVKEQLPWAIIKGRAQRFKNSSGIRPLGYDHHQIPLKACSQLRIQYKSMQKWTLYSSMCECYVLRCTKVFCTVCTTQFLILFYYYSFRQYSLSRLPDN